MLLLLTVVFGSAPFSCFSWTIYSVFRFFFFQAEDGIRDGHVTGVQTCALPIFTFLRPGIPAPLAHNSLRQLAVGRVRHQLQDVLLERLRTELRLGPRTVIEELLVRTPEKPRGLTMLIGEDPSEVADLTGHSRAKREGEPDLGTGCPDPTSTTACERIDHRPLDRNRQRRERDRARELEAHEPEERRERALEVGQCEVGVVHRLQNHTIGMLVVDIPNRRTRRGVAGLKIEVTGHAREQPKLGRHVVPASKAHRRSMDPCRRSAVDRLQRPDAVEVELLLVYTGSTLAGLRHLVESAEDGIEVAALAQLVLDKALHRLRRSSGQGQRDSTVIAV